MIFDAPRTSVAATSALNQLGAQLSGQKPPIPFAQAQDDGSLKFPDLDPTAYGDSRAPQKDDATVGELAGLRVQRVLTMALKRDAQHLTASRGRLLLHGAQTRLLALHVTSNQLSLVFK